MVHLRQVFERLELYNLKISGEKCHFAVNELDYLGYRIKGDTIQPQDKHLLAINNFTSPRTKKRLQSFLGLCNWVREYVPNLSTLTIPLTHLLKKGVTYKWTPECEKAFNQIKTEISKPLVLHRPDFSKVFILQTDASESGIGAVLFQEGNNGEKRIISYASATLTETEKRYHINEIECLSVIVFIKKYSAFLADKPFILRTDSRALLWLSRQRDAKTKLTRWSLLLQEYTFDIEHVPGRANELPDFLSRNPDTSTPRTPVDEERLYLPDPTVTHQLAAIEPYDLLRQCQEAQRRSRAIQRMRRRWLRIRQNGPVTPSQDKFLADYEVLDNHVYRKKDNRRKLLIPKSVMPAVISFFHDETHPGGQETTRQISRFYHHKNLRRLVQHYVRNCTDCFRVKSQHPQPEAPMRAHTPTQPFEVLSIDTLGPYTVSRRNNRYILIVEDVFSKWVEARAFSKISTNTVVRYLEEEIISRFGSPRAIISDNGMVFNSKKYHKFCEDNHIEVRHAAIYHQRANPVERRVQELKKVLRAIMLNRQESRWDEYLHKALFTLRNRFNEATGTTPADLVLGHTLPVPGTWKLPPAILEAPPPPLRDERITAAREHQVQYQQRYSSGEQPQVTFQPGDQVMVKVFTKRKDCFSPVWDGPCLVTRHISDTIYEVQRGEGISEVHIDDLRPAPRGIQPDDYQSDDDYDDQPPDPPDETPDDSEDVQPTAGPSHHPDPVQAPGEPEGTGSKVSSKSEDQQSEGSNLILTLSRDDLPLPSITPENEPAAHLYAECSRVTKALLCA